MKVLLLVQKEQRIILDRLYESIAAHCELCDIRWLTSAEQADLKSYFQQHVDTSRYDRIVFFLRFKKEIRQRRFIRTVPNLVILEHDAYQNYIPGKYRGQFSRHYRHLPWARILCSGAEVSRKLQAEGFDAVFVPKGYDHALLRNLGRERTVGLGFVGSTGNKVYGGRKQFLEELGRLEPLEVVRTGSGREYLEKLNDIRFFVSADIGLGEYMIKNFEAMACGCVLFAYDQGEAENRALGFVDLQNIVLYRNIEELRSKLSRLRGEPRLAAAIAEAGQRLVEARYSFAVIGKRISAALEAPLTPRSQRRSWWQRALHVGRGKTPPTSE